MRLGSRVFAISFLCLFASPALAQPRIVNARMTPRSVASLEREFKSIVTSQTTPAWIGYAVPVVEGDRQMCCFNSVDSGRSIGCCGGCALEENSNGISINNTRSARVSLEGGNQFLILFRVHDRSVGKMRIFSEDCEIDAGGLPVFWLTDVRPGDSIALLSAFATAAPDQRAEDTPAARLAETAVGAVALHNDPAADTALAGFLSLSRAEALRKRVTFWAGSARGRQGLEMLRRVVRGDPSERVRESALFGLSVSQEPEAVALMIAAARDDVSSRVRGQALFWLAQKAGKRAAAAITDAVERDPETDVKKKAVFALSQLPKEEGVPLLIQVARTNKNPAVRKQAMFWLGQSNDPRALRFFEEVLR